MSYVLDTIAHPSGGFVLGSIEYPVAETDIVIVSDFDGSNIDAGFTVVTDPSGASPLIEFATRPATRSGTNGSGWRQVVGAVENAGGRTPVFRFDRGSMTNAAPTPSLEWRPVWTQDFKTWTRAPGRTLVGGTSGYIEFQFTNPLPAGRVYIASHPMGRQTESDALAAELLAEYSAVASPTLSADSAGVFFTSPAETDENGRQIGGKPMHAIKLAWGGATTDGGPKRKLVMFAGIHAQGESSCWLCFEAAVRWMLEDVSSAAAAFRANWDVYLYFLITPNGTYGGHRRHNFRSAVDANRDFSGISSLAEVAAVRTACAADTSGAIDAFFSWHNYSNAQDLFIPIGFYDDPAVDRFVEIGTTVFGEVPRPGSASTLESTDHAFGKLTLGALVSFDSEVQQRGNTSVETHEFIGEAWMKTLQLGDAEGMFYEPSEGVTLTPSPGHIAAAGHAPDIVQGQGQTLTPAPGHATFAGHAPSIVAGAAQTLTPSSGVLLAAGHSPTITQGAAQTLTPRAGALTAAGHVPVLEQGFAQSLTPVAGHVAAQGYRPEIQQDSGITLTPAVGHIRATGHAPALAQPRTLAPQAGRVAALGHRPSVSQSVTLAPQRGRVSARGHRPGIEQGGARTLTPACGRLRLTGYRPMIGTADYEAGPALKNSIFISLPADTGVFITARAGGDAFVSG